MPQPRLRKLLTAPDLTSGQQELLKWAAIITMVVDHAAVALLAPEQAVPFRAVGRLAWPLFAYLLAYNIAKRGVDPTRYLKPLLLGFVASIIPHHLLSGGGLNILGTLFLGVATIVLLQPDREIPNSLRAPALLLILLLSPFTEYRLPGALLTPILWWALRARKRYAPAMALLATAAQNYPWPLWPYALPALALPHLAAKLPVRLPRIKHLAWVFYPAHLLVLGLIKHLFT